ncbi:MAG: Hsp20/alpha crystallin family protein [Pseudomonadota bacterium]
MTRDRKDPSGREALEEIETRLGDLFGTLGTALNSVIDLANDAESRNGDGLERSFDVSNGAFRAQSSVRVRVGGLDGGSARDTRDVSKPVNQPKSRSTQDAKPSAREPVIDTFTDEGYWVLTAEMPGIPEDAVSIKVDGNMLVLKAEGSQSYRTEVNIPPELDPESLEHAVTNGILEMRGRLRTTGEDQ